MQTIALVLGMVSLGLVAPKFAGGSRRTALMATCVLWGTTLTAITELLSAFRHVDRHSVTAAWLSVTVALVVYARGRFGIEFWRRWHLLPLNWIERALLFVVCAIAGYSLLLALVAPPNTWDSMTYHMSRVAHWKQNKNISFYPTSILRQLHSNPWSEYAILHLQVLSNGDRYANLIQWVASIGSMVGVSSIARHLGANRIGQLSAAVFCATIPMGILQSTSTQTDYVCAFWLICFIEFGFRLRTRPHFGNACLAGAALGLAILTKGTAYIYAAPFITAFGVFYAFRKNSGQILVLGVIGAVVLLINSTHYVRNYSLYGKPLGPGTEGGDFVYNNKSIGVGITVSNAIRNLGLHVGVGDTSDVMVETAVYDLHKVVGLSTNSPDATWPGTQFHVIGPTQNEDNTGNPLHLTLLFLTFGYVFFSWKRNGVAAAYGALLCAGFLFFCAALKWQPWHSRLHLPLFVMCAPLAGLMLGRLRRPYATMAVAGILGAAAVPTMLYSVQKPSIGAQSVFSTSRAAQYFRIRPDLLAPYLNAAREIRKTGCLRIGIAVGLNDWEYPLWPLLSADAGKVARITHVGVTNPSSGTLGEASAEVQSMPPCAVFSTIVRSPDEITVDGMRLHKFWSEDTISLYQPVLSDGLVNPLLKNELILK